MKLTKIKIEEMANEIMNFLKEEKLSDDVLIYFNNKRMNKDGIEEGEFNPKNYFEYAAENHILSMSFEGGFYGVVNGYCSTKYANKVMNLFEDILRKYGVYYELGNAWNLTCCLINDDTEVEYTYYQSDPEPIRIYDLEDVSVPYEIRTIGYAWKNFQEIVGDVGSCVLGAGFKFKYKGKEYFLTPCSRYQGSISWERNKDDIERMLNEIGATDIRYNWGVMD